MAAIPDRTPPSEDGPQSDAQRFYDALGDLFGQYPEMTVYETIGAMEAFKVDLLDKLAEMRRAPETPEAPEAETGEEWKSGS